MIITRRAAGFTGLPDLCLLPRIKNQNRNTQEKAVEFFPRGLIIIRTIKSVFPERLSNTLPAQRLVLTKKRLLKPNARSGILPVPNRLQGTCRVLCQPAEGLMENTEQESNRAAAGRVTVTRLLLQKRRQPIIENLFSPAFQGIGL